MPLAGSFLLHIFLMNLQQLEFQSNDSNLPSSPTKAHFTLTWPKDGTSSINLNLGPWKSEYQGIEKKKKESNELVLSPGKRAGHRTCFNKESVQHMLLPFSYMPFLLPIALYLWSSGSPCHHNALRYYDTMIFQSGLLYFSNVHRFLTSYLTLPLRTLVLSTQLAQTGMKESSWLKQFTERFEWLLFHTPPDILILGRESLINKSIISEIFKQLTQEKKEKKKFLIGNLEKNRRN